MQGYLITLYTKNQVSRSFCEIQFRPRRWSWKYLVIIVQIRSKFNPKITKNIRQSNHVWRVGTLNRSQFSRGSSVFPTIFSTSVVPIFSHIKHVIFKWIFLKNLMKCSVMKSLKHDKFFPKKVILRSILMIKYIQCTYWVWCQIYLFSNKQQ